MSQSKANDENGKGCALFEIGCVEEYVRDSDKVCKSCILTPTRNIWDHKPRRLDLVKLKADAAESYIQLVRQTYPCVMLSIEHIEKPWAVALVKAKIIYEMENTPDGGEAEREIVERKARRTITCEGTPDPNMFCRECSIVIREKRLDRCEGAFCRSVGEYCILNEA